MTGVQTCALPIFLFDQLAVLFEFLQFLLVISGDPFEKVSGIQQFIKTLCAQKCIDIAGLIPFVHIPDSDHHAFVLPFLCSFCLFQTGLCVCDLLFFLRDLSFQIRQVIADFRQLTVQIIQLSLEGILFSLQVLQIIIFLIQLILQVVFLFLLFLNLLPEIGRASCRERV